MSTIQAFVPYWNQKAIEYAEQISQKCGLEVQAVHGYEHEPVVLNRMLERCQADYCWFLDLDDQIIDENTPYILMEHLDQHPEVGVALPDVEGEKPGWRQPEDWYVRDGTAMLYRMSIGVKFDEDYIFTGWNDVDFGEEVIARGYQVHLTHNTSVIKQWTKYGSWSSFRSAYNARNRLLLEAKWYWVGIENWGGAYAYSYSCPPERKIPSMYELAWWSEQQLTAFAESVNIEQPRILLKDDQGTGNESWVLPEICR